MNTFLPFQWMWDEAKNNGVDFINGVMIIYDPTKITHGIEIISKMGPLLTPNLFALYEHDGTLCIVWKKEDEPTLQAETLELSDTGFVVDTYVIIPTVQKVKVIKEKINV